ncbi:MAG: iron ABC transporter permease [Methanomassiliicoccales archaeon]
MKGKECGESDGVKGTFNASKRRKLIFIMFLAALLAVASVIALGVGAVDIPIMDTLRSIGNKFFPNWIDSPSKDYYSTIIINSRAPRVVLAIITGISLAMSGVVMQGLLRNPLVSPFTLGLSSAASFGAAMALVLGPTLLGAAYYGHFDLFDEAISNKNLFIILLAFIFGMSSVALVLAIARTQHLAQSVMVLSGIVVNYLFTAGISFMKYVSEDNTLREITLWLMGGMWGATWSSVIILIPIVLVCFFLMERCTVDINTLSSGDDVARNLGVNVHRLRIYGLTLSALVTSACLAFTGVIGFIGLMAPHICKMVIGNDHRYLLPASALMGALILLISDTVARIIMRPTELPVGIIMYLIGGAFFIWLVTRKSGRYLT